MNWTGVTDLVLLGLQRDVVTKLVQAGQDVAEGGDGILAQGKVENGHDGRFLGRRDGCYDVIEAVVPEI